MTNTACPLCQGRRLRRRLTFNSPPELTAETFSVRECRECGHLFIDPKPSAELLTQLYKSEAYYSYLTKEEMIKGRAPVDDDRWALIRKHLSGGTIIDYSCGSGIFLSRADRSIFNAVGVEPSLRLAEFARDKLGLKVHASLQELEPMDRSPEAITMWDVLEHVVEPAKALQECAELLPSGGLLVIGVPNAGGLEVRMFGGHWLGWWTPLHLHHFKPPILRQLLDQNGFQLVEEEFIQHAGITFESAELFLGRDSKELGIFPPRGHFRSLLPRLAIGWSPALTERCAMACVRLIQRLTTSEQHRHRRSYLTIVARRK